MTSPSIHHYGIHHTAHHIYVSTAPNEWQLHSHADTAILSTTLSHIRDMYAHAVDAMDARLPANHGVRTDSSEVAECVGCNGEIGYVVRHEHIFEQAVAVSDSEFVTEMTEDEDEFIGKCDGRLTSDSTDNEDDNGNSNNDIDSNSNRSNESIDSRSIGNTVNTIDSNACIGDNDSIGNTVNTINTVNDTITISNTVSMVSTNSHNGSTTSSILSNNDGSTTNGDRQCETSHRRTTNKGSVQADSMKVNGQTGTGMPVYRRNIFHSMKISIGGTVGEDGQCSCSDDYQMIMQPLRYTWASRSMHVYETGRRNAKRKQCRIVLKRRCVVRPLSVQEESSDEKYKF